MLERKTLLHLSTAILLNIVQKDAAGFPPSGSQKVFPYVFSPYSRAFKVTLWVQTNSNSQISPDISPSIHFLFSFSLTTSPSLAGILVKVGRSIMQSAATQTQNTFPEDRIDFFFFFLVLRTKSGNS